MKNVILILIGLFLFLGNIFSQDIIYKKDGSEIKAKVEKIGEDKIEYKLFDQLEGPTRLLLQSDVYMIRYFDGREEKFQVEKKKEEFAQAPKKPENSEALNKSQNSFSINAGAFAHFYYNEDMTDAFGSMALFGAGFGADLNNVILLFRFHSGSKGYDENWRLVHTQMDLLADLKWYNSPNDKATVYSGIGFSFISLSDKGPDNFKESGTGIGVLIELGLDIRLSQKLYLFITSTSLFGSVDIYDEKINVGGERFGIGLKTNF